jgi:hypothetical protein
MRGEAAKVYNDQFAPTYTGERAKLCEYTLESETGIGLLLLIESFDRIFRANLNKIEKSMEKGPHD